MYLGTGGQDRHSGSMGDMNAERPLIDAHDFGWNLADLDGLLDANLDLGMPSFLPDGSFNPYEAGWTY